MYPNKFDYLRPATLDEALSLMEAHGHDARPLAGGQSLLPLMKLRLMQPKLLIDLARLPGLSYVEDRDGRLRVGPLTKHVEIEESSVVQDLLPLAHDAVSLLGDVQVRNFGTVGGAVAEADPAGDWGPALLALDGEVTCTGTGGSRILSGTEFFVDYLTSSLEPTELITQVSLRVPSGDGQGGAYVKLERRVGDFAVVSAGVQLRIDADGFCREIGVGLGGVGSTPIKPRSVEEALLGSRLDDATITDAAGLIRELVDPPEDGRGPAWYKRDMAGVIFGRSLKAALARSHARSRGSSGRSLPELAG